MKSLLFLVTVLAVIFCTDALFQRKGLIDNCNKIRCPRNTVKYAMTEDNNEDPNIIVTTAKCMNINGKVLKQQVKRRPNNIKGLAISSTMPSYIEKLFHFSFKRNPLKPKYNINSQLQTLKVKPTCAPQNKTVWTTDILKFFRNFNWNPLKEENLKQINELFLKLISWLNPFIKKLLPLLKKLF